MPYNQRFGESCRLCHQGWQMSQARNQHGGGSKNSYCRRNSYLLFILVNDRFSPVQTIHCRIERWFWLVKWGEFELTRRGLLWVMFPLEEVTKFLINLSQYRA
jgi:hypothetical protein